MTAPTTSSFPDTAAAATAYEYTTPLVPASTATLTLAARHTCSAPAALVFRTLRNTESWRDWNRFCPRVTIRSQPDDSDEVEAQEFWAAHAGRFGGPHKAAEGVQRIHAEGTERRRASLQIGSAAPGGGPNGVTPQRKSIDSSATLRRTSIASGHAVVARNLRQMGGEPSVRLKDGTHMTFHVRMKLPHKLTDYTDSALVVTEVSRPNDAVHDHDHATGLTTTQTHTDDPHRTGIYRISWATESAAAALAAGSRSRSTGPSYPKFMLQAQRVHEIRPIVDALTGKETGCEIVTWECQRGVLAKVVKKVYGKYLQERFEEWAKSLGEYCEEFVGKVDRRDFGVAVAAPAVMVGT